MELKTEHKQPIAIRSVKLCRSQKKLIRLFLFPLLTLIVVLHTNTDVAISKPVVVPNGFGNGQSYQQLPVLERQAYVQGMVNGILSSTLFGASENKIQKVHDCIGGMNDEQMRLVFDLYISQHPETIEQQAHILFYQALSSACVKRGKPF